MPPQRQDLLGHASDGAPAPPPPPPRRGLGDLGAAPRRVCRSGTVYDHPGIKGPLDTLPYQGGPGTLSSLTNADRAGAVR